MFFVKRTGWSKGLSRVLLSRPVFTTSGLLSGAAVVCLRAYTETRIYMYICLSLPFVEHATRTIVTPFDVAEERLSILTASLLPDFRIKKCRQRHNREEPLPSFSLSDFLAMDGICFFISFYIFKIFFQKIKYTFLNNGNYEGLYDLV